jgi:predicted RNA-binding Zn ribbon-like protein
VVANDVLQQAITLREATYRIFSNVAAVHPPAPDDLGILNVALPDAMSHLQVVALPTGFTWDWTASLDALDQMLWPVVRSAADLLTSDDLDRVRECADDRGCGYLFIDRSRNRSRRWCSMESCGNRAKVVRYLERRSD